MVANTSSAPVMRAGTVYLAGAGPGDPELPAQRAARLLGEAEVIVYNRYDQLTTERKQSWISIKTWMRAV